MAFPRGSCGLVELFRRACPIRHLVWIRSMEYKHQCYGQGDYASHRYNPCAYVLGARNHCMGDRLARVVRLDLFLEAILPPKHSCLGLFSSPLRNHDFRYVRGFLFVLLLALPSSFHIVFWTQNRSKPPDWSAFLFWLRSPAIVSITLFHLIHGWCLG